MGWMKVRFTPGFNRDRTYYATDGGWYDGNLVRFREGLPESWGGWTRFNEDFVIEGICRSVHRFSDLAGSVWLGLGTSSRFYVAQDDLYYEVTPFIGGDTLNTDPLATVDESSIVTVEHVGHVRLPGTYVVISGATTTNGIPDTVLNAEHMIVDVVDDDHYTIDVGVDATSTGDGGGSAVEVNYLYSPGSGDQFYGGGWGSGTWGEGDWGEDEGSGGGQIGDQIGIWSQGSWGEDLIANASNGPIFYWDATNPDDRMINIRDLSGADGNAPLYSKFIIVSHKDRHLLAFGGSEFSTGNAAPLAVRWCSQENILNWDEASTTGTAGSIPFSRGSKFMAGISTQREILVWTDAALYSMQYIGAPYIYAVDLIADFSDINGMKSCTVYNDAVFWWGRSGFYMYDGRVTRIPCPVWDYINNRTDYSQNEKIFGDTIRMFGEVIWYYQSVDGDEIDSYVCYNVDQNLWTYGILGRTAWLDSDPFHLPIGITADGRIFNHEDGGSDTEVDPPVPLNAWLESAPFELSSEGAYDKGDRFAFVTRILPDVTFRYFETEVQTPRVELQIRAIDKPGGDFTDTDQGLVTRVTIDHKENFTQENHVRIRGRALALRVATVNRGTRWRLGVPRVYIRADGQR